MGKSGSIEDKKKNVTRYSKSNRKSFDSGKNLMFQKNIVYSLKRRFSEDKLNEYYNKYINQEKDVEPVKIHLLNVRDILVILN